MAATRFALTTLWTLDKPIDRVWALIERTEDWPLWWPAVVRVEPIRAGDETGLGAVRRLTWRTALPYRIAFDVEVTRIDPMCLIEGQARGELDGAGRWTFTQEDDRTHVRYDWEVEVTKPWMRRLAPLLRPMFAWNHAKVMAWGEAGARPWLASSGA